MTDLDALLAGIVDDPHNALRWLVMADWLEDHGQPERAELVRVHRELLRTCTATRETKARKQLHSRMMELLRAGVQPCLPQKTITLPGGVELKMSFIPPGSFLMGSPKSEAARSGDETRHLVTLTRGFWLGVTAVTQGQWRAVMGTDPSHFKGDELPVENVSWDDAQEFCTAVRERTGVEVRLPTEAEWEYAARAGTTTPFHWGGELDGTQSNCNGEYPYGTDAKGPFLETTTAVGSYAGVSPHPWGLADVIGNVWEWCGDWYGAYADGEAVDPMGPKSGSHRVIRGGCWDSVAANCRTECRGRLTPGFRDYYLGFRLAAVPSGPILASYAAPFASLALFPAVAVFPVQDVGHHVRRVLADGVRERPTEPLGGGELHGRAAGRRVAPQMDEPRDGLAPADEPGQQVVGGGVGRGRLGEQFAPPDHPVHQHPPFHVAQPPRERVVADQPPQSFVGRHGHAVPPASVDGVAGAVRIPPPAPAAPSRLVSDRRRPYTGGPRRTQADGTPRRADFP